MTRRRRARDLDREIRPHLDLQTEEQSEAGGPPAEESYAAQRAFGNMTLIQEVTRGMWGWA